uniref:Uncharacterized protein n=1 Tax=Rhizophora mucronata TaxID=61149 RepID=A0A2P2Q1Q8_RHIMU
MTLKEFLVLVWS